LKLDVRYTKTIAKFGEKEKKNKKFFSLKVAFLKKKYF